VNARTSPFVVARQLAFALRLPFALCLVFAPWLAVARAACPFCEALVPTFAERRAESRALVLGETVAAADKSPVRTFAVRQTIDGSDALGSALETISCEAPDAKPGGLALLFGSKKTAESAWSWEALPVEEAALVYYLRAPKLDKPAAERLPYFAKFLEHAERQVADDAFSEFGRAPFDAVAAVEASLPYDKFRRALVDVNVPGARKGFYGMALGLAKNEAELAANRPVLERLVRDEGAEFRAGFDGILGGYLLADGTAALDEIDSRFLAYPAAREGDVRHAQRALRFYLQYGRTIPVERLTKSLVLLLDRPATAPGALSDLTRRQAWGHVDRAVKLFAASPGDDPSLDQAVVGYFLVNPQPEARAALKKLKADSPERTADALRHWQNLGLGERS
jgi:hypothetical protein